MSREQGSIREAEASDADAILAIYAPNVTGTHFSFEEEVPDRREILRRLESSHLWVVHEVEGRITGYAYGRALKDRSAYRWSSELAIYVDGSERRRGTGRALLEELLNGLRRRGMVNAFAVIALPNRPSVSLVESMGFREIGVQEKVGFKRGTWIDVGWWQLQLQDPTIPPPELGDASGA